MSRWRPTWRRLPWWLELLTIGLGYVTYEVLRYYSPREVPEAYAHARSIIHAEQILHVKVEVRLNEWLTGHHALTLVSGYFYVFTHFLLTPLILVLLWRWRPAVYPWLRSSLVIMSFAALVIYWRYPVAPPRFAEAGAIDTLAGQNIVGIDSGHGVSGLINEYAAMPSLHIGWAAWCALAVVLSFRSRWRHLAWLYPVAMAAVVLSTANHYVLDAVAGVALLGLAMVVTRPAAAPATIELRSRSPVAVTRSEPDRAEAVG